MFFGEVTVKLWEVVSKILLNSYPYGFNGMEQDNEIKGKGNSLDFGARIYDSRLGRFLSVDPWSYRYPDMSPYQFAGNMPIWAIDYNGLGWLIYNFYKVSKVQLSNGNHKFITEQIKVNDKPLRSRVEDKSFDGEATRNWFLYGNNMYNSQNQIPGWYDWRKSQQEKVNSIAVNSIVVTGGALAILVSGGTAAPGVLELYSITTGLVAVTGGTTKIILNIQGKPELAAKIPDNLLEGTVGITMEYLLKDKKSGKETSNFIRATASLIDGILTLDPKAAFKINSLMNANESVFSITNIAIDASQEKEAIENLGKEDVKKDYSAPIDIDSQE